MTDACSASYKCLGEGKYALAVYSRDVMAINQWSWSEMCFSMLTTGTTDISVNHESMVFQEKLFSAELLLSGVHCYDWANASFMHFSWLSHTLNSPGPF